MYEFKSSDVFDFANFIGAEVKQKGAPNPIPMATAIAILGSTTKASRTNSAARAKTSAPKKLVTMPMAA